jgi:hypothetical protein
MRALDKIKEYVKHVVVTKLNSISNEWFNTISLLHKLIHKYKFLLNKLNLDKNNLTISINDYELVIEYYNDSYFSLELCGFDIDINEIFDIQDINDVLDLCFRGIYEYINVNSKMELLKPFNTPFKKYEIGHIFNIKDIANDFNYDEDCLLLELNKGAFDDWFKKVPEVYNSNKSDIEDIDDFEKDFFEDF